MMLLPSLFAEAFHSLMANRLRSALAMLGIVIGVASVIIMIAVGEGGQRSVRKIIENMGSNVLIISGPQGMKVNAGKPLDLSLNDVEVLHSVPLLAAVAPLTEPNYKTVASSGGTSYAQVIGTTPEFFAVRDWRVSEGSLFSEEENARSARVAVIGQSVAQRVFRGNFPIGQTLRVDQMPFQVIGVLQKKGRDLSGQDQDNAVYVPFQYAAQRLTQKEGDSSRKSPVQTIMARVRAGESLHEAGRMIRESLRAERKMDAIDDDPFSIRSISELAKGALKTRQVMTLLLGAIASISLVVGGIGIMNIMYVCVTERTREIGVRKSIGARKRDILTQFLLEAVLISLIGCAAGVLAGLGGVWVAENYFDVPAAISLNSIGISVATAVGIGMFFGYYPARKAANLLPVEALRYF